MSAAAKFPFARTRTGMYESFYLRAVSPDEPIGVWIRHTVHKPPGRPPLGSIWCTVFDARKGEPFMHKLSTNELSVPADGWIGLGPNTSIGPGRADGSCGAARWSLRFSSNEPQLRHLSPALLYRAPLPRTKLTSPAPAASFDGVLELDDGRTVELRGWPGMVGHNWGSQHAERWIWLHGICFHDEPHAWLDVALGRLAIAGRMTPWVANGVLSVDGHRRRLGGLTARGTHVRESAQGCELQLAGQQDLALHASVHVPAHSAAGWRYSDPDGGEHDVVNCSVAELQLTVQLPNHTQRTLHSAHGCAYELGMRERDHGVRIAPFADG
jgi:hypothetical protein